MTSLEIVVRGSARRKYPPELADVNVVVHVEGPSREDVYADAARAHNLLVSDMTVLKGSGEIDDWSSESVRVYTYRPYDQKGRLRDPVYSTRIRADARFVDFEALSEFIGRWAATDGVDVGGVRWNVTDENRLAYQRELRKAAVDDAVAKAQAYADAVGRGQVVATQLADPDMLGEGGPSPRMMLAVADGAPSGGAQPALELRSEDIELAVSVDARFVAD